MATLIKSQKKPKGISTNQLVTTEHLENFKSELLNELVEILSAAPVKPKEWIKSSEVQKLLNISHGTLQNLRITGTLPYTKIGGSMYYKYQDVINMLEKNNQRQ